MLYVAVGLAGIMGAILRYGMGVLFPAVDVWGFPLGTFLVNEVGCFVLGWFMTWSSTREMIPRWVSVSFATGFIGSLTTFSTFSVEMVQMIQAGAWFLALIYGLSSVWGGVLLVWLGCELASKMDKQKRVEEEVA